MRRLHRWLAVIFAFFLLWIAGTGVATHVVDLWPEEPVSAVPEARAHGDEAPAVTEQMVGAEEGFVCPETMICRPRPEPGSRGAVISFLHHIHSGEEFGPAGTAISLLSGLALLFFALSGLAMYARMWAQRRRAKLAPRWFWR